MIPVCPVLGAPSVGEATLDPGDGSTVATTPLVPNIVGSVSDSSPGEAVVAVLGGSVMGEASLVTVAAVVSSAGKAEPSVVVGPTVREVPPAWESSVCVVVDSAVAEPLAEVGSPAAGSSD